MPPIDDQRILITPLVAMLNQVNELAAPAS